MEVKSEKGSFLGAWIAIILPVLFLSALGLLILTSAGANRADPYMIVRKQSIWLCVAFAAGIFAAFVDLKLIKKLSIPLAIGTLVLLALVLIPAIGKEVNGARRWLEFGPILIQPSDIAKFSLIILLSSYLHDNQRRMGEFLTGIIKPFCILGAFCMLIILEPDFGTTALCGAVGFTLIFLAGAKVRYLGSLVLLAVAAFAVAIYHNPVRLQRIMSFMDVEGTKADGSYQLYQALLAFGSGGVEGVGIGRGRQQLSFLPEAHTDFVFAIVGEELGLIFTIAVVTAFFILFIATIYSLRKAPNMYEFSLCTGAMLMIVLQALFNLCVVTGLMPTKGISLPFISYGGSNLVAMFAFTGLLINCVRSWSKPTQIKISEL